MIPTLPPSPSRYSARDDDRWSERAASPGLSNAASTATTDSGGDNGGRTIGSGSFPPRSFGSGAYGPAAGMAMGHGTPPPLLLAHGRDLCRRCGTAVYAAESVSGLPGGGSLWGPG